MIFNIFGSESSIDYDIMVFLESIPSIQESKKICLDFEKELQPILSDKKLNINLAVVKDGIITNVFKGTPDECNNSILETYNLHKQIHPIQINKSLPRDVPLKVARAIRIILSFMSRSEYRALVKEALRSDTKKRFQILEQIDISKIVDLGKNNQDLIEFYKHVAFQLGQCLGLFQGVELYTKEDMIKYFPELGKYLMRIPSDPLILQEYKEIFINMTKKLFNNLDIVKENRDVK